MSFFKKIGSFFMSLFKNPNTLQVAQATLKVVGPIVIGVASAADPQDAPLIRQVVYEVMTDLAAVSGVLSHIQQSGDTSLYGRATGMVEGIVENLNSLLTGAHVKNPALTGSITTAVEELNQVISALKQNPTPVNNNPAAPAAPAAAPAVTASSGTPTTTT